jgi:hypothetical protein
VNHSAPSRLNYKIDFSYLVTDILPWQAQAASCPAPATGGDGFTRNWISRVSDRTVSIFDRAYKYASVLGETVPISVAIYG